MFEPDLYKSLLDELYDGIYIVDPTKKITYWNRSAERLTGYKASEICGKQCGGDILVHSDEHGITLCNRTCPVAETISDGKRREAEAYLRHKDGHRVPVLMCVSPIRNSAGEIVGAVEIFSDNSWNVTALNRIEELRKISMRDVLTEVANRRFIEMNLDNLISGMKRYGMSFSLLFLDIDHFKKVNDTYGHDIGDKVLRMVAKTLSNSLRPLDILGRWGGEEFVILLLNAREDSLYSIAERFRVLIENSSLSTDSGTICVTASIGVTPARPDDDTGSIIKRADTLMYESKTSGRNRVTAESGGGPPVTFQNSLS